MKMFNLLFSLFVTLFASAQTPLIHAHNDYQKPEPLVNAIQQKVYSLEADIFLVGDSLRVAHDAGRASNAPTLNSLYLQPIIDLFAKYEGKISSDSIYSPILMIDIKRQGEAVLAVLQKQIEEHDAVFNRAVNPRAVQIVISGDRGPLENWKNYSSTILFDGRPYENYDSLTLNKIGFISDAYYNYILGSGKLNDRFRQVAIKVHSQGKLLRLWAAPDNPKSWKRLFKLGVDMLNTDRVSKCRKYFSF